MHACRDLGVVSFAVVCLVLIATPSATAQEGGGQVPGLEYPDIDIGDDAPGGSSDSCMECQRLPNPPDAQGQVTYFYRCYRPPTGYNGKTDCRATSSGCTGNRCTVLLV